MDDFISKLQYKTYEKGEYADERARDLSETLALIKSFPWDQQRALADVQLTCPSVTIFAYGVAYLKIGPYFNNKYIAYYLDANHHLYERPLPTMDDVEQVVTELFDDAVDMVHFERTYLHIAPIRHFETNLFEYRVKVWWQALLMGFLLIYVCILFALGFAGLTFGPFAGAIIPALFGVLFGYVLLRGVTNVYKSRNMYLQLSQGHDEFRFGKDLDNIEVYRKTDISEIVISNYNSRLSAGWYNIRFKDGTSISFSYILLPLVDLMTKFPRSLYRFEKRRFFWY